MIPRSNKARRSLFFLFVSAICLMLYLSLDAAEVDTTDYTPPSWATIMHVAQMAGLSLTETTFDWPVGGDGKLTVPVDRNGDIVGSPRHPIYDLVDRAEANWDATVSKQSRTLKQAVLEYQRRYGRMPPKGFDVWWKFASINGVMLIDEFDQIEHDIKPFLALPPYIVTSRLEDLQHLPFSLHIQIKDGEVTVSGPLQRDRRALDIADFIKGFSQYLPDMIVYMSGHDSGSQIFGEDLRQEVERVMSENNHIAPINLEYFENKKRNDRKTYTNACFDDSPSVLNPNKTEEQPRPITFVSSHRQSMDFCQNPSLLHGHGAFWYDVAHGSRMAPYFVMSKLEQGGELLLPALAGWKDRSNQTIPTWSERTDSRLFWRGRSTGAFFNRHRRWWDAHRTSLHRMANSIDLADDLVDVLVESQDGKGLVRQRYERQVLNEKYLDVGLVGKPTQCSVEDGTCAEMSKDVGFLPLAPGTAGLSGKYSLDVDGNGWSQRYQKLLASGSAVLKATIYPEWNTNWLIPWYHYIPVQHDYSDLYDIMSFFVGSPEGGAGHDDIAQRIAQHSVDFVAKNWRWEDLQAYMFRLLLEYARVISNDRDAVTMQMSDI